MFDSAQTAFFVSVFVGQLPILLVSLVACAIIITRWRDASSGAIWALAGFGLSLILCVLIPLGQTLIQHWVMQGGDTIARRAPLFAGFSLLWSLLRAASYAMLLVAVLAGRTTPSPATQLPLRQD